MNSLVAMCVRRARSQKRVCLIIASQLIGENILFVVRRWLNNDYDDDEALNKMRERRKIVRRKVQYINVRRASSTKVSCKAAGAANLLYA